MPCPRGFELLAPTCPESLPAAGSKEPGTIRPRKAPPLSLHLSYHNDCVIISRALISSPQGGYMVHAARASAPRATAPPSPIQSLAKHNRKPLQLTENKHQRSNSIASFCRNLFAPPPHPTNDDLPFTYDTSRITNHQPLLTHHAFLIATRQLLEIELTPSQQTRKHFLIATNFDLSASVPHRDNPLRIFLIATDPDSEIWQPYETKRETIF